MQHRRAARDGRVRHVVGVAVEHGVGDPVVLLTREAIHNNHPLVAASGGVGPALAIAGKGHRLRTDLREAGADDPVEYAAPFAILQRGVDDVDAVRAEME